MKKSDRRKPSGSKIVGNLIKSSRRRLGMTGKHLADLVGINKTHVSKIEHGVHAPDFLIAKKISEALNEPRILKLFLQEQYPDINDYFLDELKTLVKMFKEKNTTFDQFYKDWTSGNLTAPH